MEMFVIHRHVKAMHRTKKITSVLRDHSSECPMWYIQIFCVIFFSSEGFDLFIVMFIIVFLMEQFVLGIMIQIISESPFRK